MPRLTPLCEHVFSTGRCCGSPKLTDSDFCYWHHTARAPRAARPKPGPSVPNNSVIPMPFVEDADSLMISLQEIMQAIAENRIDPRRAGLLIYGIQTTASILPHLTPRRTLRDRLMINTSEEGDDLTLPPPIANESEEQTNPKLSE
jgi:hypothetical protein